MAEHNRRKFLMLTAGAAGAGGLAALGLAGSRRRSDTRSVDSANDLAPLRKASRSSHAFGTTVSLTVLHENAQTARAALDAAFAELKLVDEIMSIYRSDSQLVRLNREGRLNAPHPYFVEVLRAGQHMAARSEGAFDITVQPLWAAYAAAKKKGRLPSPEETARAKRKVNWRKLSVDDKRVRLADPGMAVTLNGIAQGYATDRSMAALKARGVGHAMINTGEVGALGSKDAQGHPWRVGIQHPRVADAFIALARLRGGCLATSGDYETTFSSDHAHHHIFDPRTGRSPETFSSVTVMAPSGLDADALSTTVFVTGLRRGLALVESTPGAEALLVRKDGSVQSTSGFPRAS